MPWIMGIGAASQIRKVLQPNVGYSGWISKNLLFFPKLGASAVAIAPVISVDGPFVPINMRDEIRRHRRTLARLRLVANRTRHARLAALAGIWMIAPRPIRMGLANPARALAGLAGHRWRTAIRRF
jgi:hypothetical protein